MHGYANFNMIIPEPQICCRYEMCTSRPSNEHSLWKLRLRDIDEKAKQNSARNNAKCSKWFQFLCNNNDAIITWFFNGLTFARSLRRCWKPRPPASDFNTSHGTWRMLMHEKTCWTPILEGWRFTINVCGWPIEAQFVCSGSLVCIITVLVITCVSLWCLTDKVEDPYVG